MTTILKINGITFSNTTIEHICTSLCPINKFLSRIIKWFVRFGIWNWNGNKVMEINSHLIILIEMICCEKNMQIDEINSILNFMKLQENFFDIRIDCHSLDSLEISRSQALNNQKKQFKIISLIFCIPIFNCSCASFIIISTLNFQE